MNNLAQGLSQGNISIQLNFKSSLSSSLSILKGFVREILNKPAYLSLCVFCLLFYPYFGVLSNLFTILENVYYQFLHYQCRYWTELYLESDNQINLSVLLPMIHFYQRKIQEEISLLNSYSVSLYFCSITDIFVHVSIYMITSYFFLKYQVRC